jgi:hypothetical protein
MPKLNDMIYLELLYFFRNNPSIMDTLDGIANKIGRTIADIDPIIREFLNIKLITENDLSGTKVFTYNDKIDRDLQKKRLLKVPKNKIVETAEGIKIGKKG